MTPYDEYDTLITALDEALQQQIHEHQVERDWQRALERAQARVTLAVNPGTDRLSRARLLAALWADEQWSAADAVVADAWRACRDADRTVEILRDRLSACRLRLQHRS